VWTPSGPGLWVSDQESSPRNARDAICPASTGQDTELPYLWASIEKEMFPHFSLSRFYRKSALLFASGLVSGYTLVLGSGGARSEFQPGHSLYLLRTNIMLLDIICRPVYVSKHNISKTRSRYSVGLRAGRPRGHISSPGSVKNFLFSISPRPGLGSTQPSTQWVLGTLSPGVNRQGVKLTSHLHLVPRSRKRGSIHPLLDTLSWRSA
jgi:hypothetical protein